MSLNAALAAVAALNLVVGLAFQWIVLTTLGVGTATDALFAGTVIPQLVLAVVGGALTHVMTPVLSGEKKADLRETAWTAFLLLLAVMGSLALVLIVAAPLWVGWLLPGFRTRDFSLAVQLTRIQLPGMVFSAAVAVPIAAWNARRRFLWAEVAPALATLVFLAALPALLSRYGVVAAAWASTGKVFLYLLIVLPGLGAWVRPSWGSPALTLIRSRLKPLLGGNLYFKSDALVDRALSSLAPPGDLSILYLGQQLWNAGSQILAVGIGRTMVPLLAGQAKAAQWREFRSSYRKRLGAMALVSGGGAVLFAVVGRRLLEILIGHGGVTAENVSALWRVMMFLAVGFVAGCVGQITSQGFYAIGDTRTPTFLGVATFTVYLPLKFLAFRSFGIYGLAGATGAFVLVNVVLQQLLLIRRLEPLKTP